jgi:hypothetical protein
VVAFVRAAGRARCSPRARMGGPWVINRGGDALRLLRVINARQAHGRVGTIVFPFAAARTAGPVPGTWRYEEALRALVWEVARTVEGCVLLEAAARLLFGRAVP